MNVSNKCQNLINRGRSDACDGNFARRQMHPWVSVMLWRWHDRILVAGGSLTKDDPTFYESLLSPLSLPASHRTHETTAHNVLHTPAKRARSIALTARGGCYGDNQAHTYTCSPIARNSHPRADITSPVCPPVDSLSHKRRRPRVWPRPFRWMTSAASRMRAQQRTSSRHEASPLLPETPFGAADFAQRTGSGRFACKQLFKFW